MPDINGIEAAKRMSMLNAQVPLVLFTMLDIGGIEHPAKAASIHAVVSKSRA
jgi:CheY-like chemotaxis protein